MVQSLARQSRGAAFSTTRPRHAARAAPVRVKSNGSTRISSTKTLSLANVAKRAGAATMTGLLTLSILTSEAGVADARPAGVNRPELLPKEQTPVIDVAGFLTPSEEKRIIAEVRSLERDTGFKLRVLAQNYPETPGDHRLVW
eukprot:GHRR01031053.1.p1 GENE.GHRR01031053.1~~GHRR01031053.1.p1  ORF type:complete len:143 (+),score=33.02 GHRR01031053.1:359-787(+)